MTQYPIFPLPQKRMLDTGVDSHLDGGHVPPLYREQEELLGSVEDAHVAVRPRGLVAVGHPVDAVALKSVRKIHTNGALGSGRDFSRVRGGMVCCKCTVFVYLTWFVMQGPPGPPHPLRPRARC